MMIPNFCTNGLGIAWKSSAAWFWTTSLTGSEFLLPWVYVVLGNGVLTTHPYPAPLVVLSHPYLQSLAALYPSSFGSCLA